MACGWKCRMKRLLLVGRLTIWSSVFLSGWGLLMMSSSHLSTNRQLAFNLVCEGTNSTAINHCAFFSAHRAYSLLLSHTHKHTHKCTADGRSWESILHCNTALLFSMHLALHSMAAGLTAITQLSVSLCVCLTPHCGLRVLRGNSGKCRGSTCLRQTFLSLAQMHTEIERALCPVVSTACLLAILILFKESKQPGVQGVAQSWFLSKS